MLSSLPWGCGGKMRTLTEGRRAPFWPMSAITAVAVCSVVVQAHAQTPKPARDFATYQPSAVATRIETSAAPTIDGDVGDAVWSKASPIDEFYQLEPKEGEPASERTVVRVLYDENNLYFSFYVYDREPGSIKASIK